MEIQQIQTIKDDLLAFEYKRRITELRNDGYRLAFDTSSNHCGIAWCAYLVHHNGNKVRLRYDVRSQHLVQKSNNIVVYDSANRTMRKS